MKKIFTFLVFLCLIGNCLAQDFPGPHYKALLGKKVTPKKILSERYDNFYVRPGSSEKYRQSGYGTPVEHLFGKIFMVINFEVNSRGTFLVLSNAEIGKLYYEYRENSPISFELNVLDDFTFPDEACSEIISTTDKFTDQITHKMPVKYEIVFIKIGPTTYVYLTTKSRSVEVGKKGVYLLLGNGKKIVNMDEEIKVKTGDDLLYHYSVMIPLTDSDLEKLRESYVTDYRLYIFDEYVYAGKLYQKHLQCILSK
nr:hypothetical protein [uncultured Flavobacterium sp.]